MPPKSRLSERFQIRCYLILHAEGIGADGMVDLSGIAGLHALTDPFEVCDVLLLVHAALSVQIAEDQLLPLNGQHAAVQTAVAAVLVKHLDQMVDGIDLCGGGVRSLELSQTLAKLLCMVNYPDSGKLWLCGKELTHPDVTDEDILAARRDIGMVFQNPDNQIVASIVEEDVAFGCENLGIPSAEIRKRVDQALEEVGMTKDARSSPHNLSGGQKQRVAIAGVIAMQPDCIILDEPTAMLDPQGRQEVMETIRRLNREKGITIILITHDLGVIAQMADDVAVMYCGQVVELAPKSKIVGRGKYLHPYTEGLLSSTPTAKKRERLETIAGSVPLPWELPKGCKFAPRCPYRTEKCLRDEPKLVKMQEGQWVRCHYAEKEVRRGEEHARFIVR